VYDRYLELLLAGDRNGCSGIVSRFLDDGIPIRNLYVELFQRSLYRVGELWEQNLISVAREHLATAVTEFLLNLVYPRIFAEEHCGRTAVVACVANEQHQLGAKMVADIMELNGWNGYFLGGNRPVTDLLSLIREQQPDLLALSLSIHANFPLLLDALAVIRRDFPLLPIIVGGQAFRWGHDFLGDFPGVSCLTSITQLEELLSRFS
jgi:MerR family transcriptional regulator, light-induced transcriptional regulator